MNCGVSARERCKQEVADTSDPELWCVEAAAATPLLNSTSASSQNLALLFLGMCTLSIQKMKACDAKSRNPPDPYFEII
jgi:hypothetical protein